MYEKVEIDNVTYHVTYKYYPEERDNIHFAPAKIELHEVFDDLGEQPDDEQLLNQIEEEILSNLNSF